MKRIAISGLFLSAALLASPVFAADLCEANLQKINDSKATLGATNENTDDNIAMYVKQAEDAKAAGDDKKCIEITNKVIERLDKLTKGGQ